MQNKFTKFSDRYKHMSAPAKAGLWYTICGFLQRGINFVTVPIFTRILTTDQYGIVSVFNSWESLVSILCTLNLFAGGFNNGMLKYKDRRDEYVSVIQGLVTVITAVWVVIYFIGHPFFTNLLELNTELVLMLFAQVLATAALSLWSAKERYVFKYRHLVIITLVNALLGSVIPIIAIYLSAPEHGAEARIVAHAGSVVMICGAVYIFNLAKGKKFYDKLIWKGAFLFNLPLLPHYLSTMVLNQADRIMIQKMVGSSEAGLYSVAYSAAMILNIMVTAINNSFAPWLYGKLEKKDYKEVPQVANMMFLGLALVLVMLIAFAPECIYVLAGSKYSDAVKIIPAVASSLYFIFMYQIFANVEFFYEKNKFIAYASVSGAVLNVILNYFGIMWFGYVAAGYTTLICYIVFGCAHYLFMKKICKQQMDNVTLFEARTIFTGAFSLVAFAIVMTLLYSHALIRYAILAGVIAVIVSNRDKVKHYINLLKEK